LAVVVVEGVLLAILVALVAILLLVALRLEGLVQGHTLLLVEQAVLQLILLVD
jgi:hypothetical protein